MQLKDYAIKSGFGERKAGGFVGILPIILFLLGTVFLFLGWRWQSPTNEEAMTALKGLAYLKREILRVQDQVHSLEDKIQAQQNQLQESAQSAREHKAREHKEMKHNAREYEEIENRKIEYGEVERSGIGRKEKSKLYSLKTKESEGFSGDGVKPNRNLSPKYQEVIELAAKGHRIPEIAQHLLLSQDAVLMVLQTQSKGARL